MKTATPIQLPRPNLGPEPWPETLVWPWLLGAVMLLSILTLFFVRFRRRRALKRSAGVDLLPEIAATPAIDIPSNLVREALIQAFGASWRARTTEEVSASPVLQERFGTEISGQVVAYLRAVDRAKFSGDSSRPSDDLDWWAARFVEEVKASPTSRITGK